uniref:CUB domain-containing protein n=1 Tax=Daphnia galeata TaxID=27404 RepID=A0A8J2S872_9CRUS|nr:unnamed protein product [Daphnia galeata]
MFLMTAFLTILCLQLLVFHLISFPFLAIQAERKAAAKSDNLLTAKMDSLINIPCNVTTVDCGSCRNVTETGGIIESLNFPVGEYNSGSNLNCLFTINAPPDKKINLSFTEFFVNECCDFINVFDGFANPLRVSLTGDDNPADVISPSNQMAVKFSSNGENIIKTEVDSSILKHVTRWQAIFTFI